MKHKYDGVTYAGNEFFCTVCKKRVTLEQHRNGHECPGPCESE